MSSAQKPKLVVGGKLHLKGDTKKSSKKRKIEGVTAGSSFTSTKNGSGKHSKDDTKRTAELLSPPEELLTAAQKRHKQKQVEADAREARKMAHLSYRDRVEVFNSKLSTLSEHNDIPRVSAAGNG